MLPLFPRLPARYTITLQPQQVTPEDIFEAAGGVISRCQGGYAVVVSESSLLFWLGSFLSCLGVGCPFIYDMLRVEGSYICDLHRVQGIAMLLW